MRYRWKKDTVSFVLAVFSISFFSKSYNSLILPIKELALISYKHI